MIIGRENEEAEQKMVVEKSNENGLVPMHMSYFPELSYAVLRSNAWEKNITNTVFFIGRN